MLPKRILAASSSEIRSRGITASSSTCYEPAVRSIKRATNSAAPTSIHTPPTPALCVKSPAFLFPQTITFALHFNAASGRVIHETAGAPQCFYRPLPARPQRTPQTNRSGMGCQPSKLCSRLPQSSVNRPISVVGGRPEQTVAGNVTVRSGRAQAIDIAKGRQSATASPPWREDGKRIAFQHSFPHRGFIGVLRAVMRDFEH